MNLVRAPPVTTAIGAVAVGIGGGGLAAMVVMRLTRVGALELQIHVSRKRERRVVARCCRPRNAAHTPPAIKGRS